MHWAFSPSATFLTVLIVLAVIKVGVIAIGDVGDIDDGLKGQQEEILAGVIHLLLAQALDEAGRFALA
jgi:hypothetical protein